MKHKMYILFLVILMIGFTLIITKDNLKSRFVSSKDIVDSSVEEDSSVVFRSKLTDKNDNILSTEGLTWEKNKVYKIIIKNTDDNVWGERIFLLLNGVQYDLNPDDPDNKYIEVEKNWDNTMTV